MRQETGWGGSHDRVIARYLVLLIQGGGNVWIYLANSVISADCDYLILLASEIICR